jgi:hypothetical protein
MTVSCELGNERLASMKDGKFLKQVAFQKD